MRDDLEAGPYLDALVAERIMGFARHCANAACCLVAAPGIRRDHADHPPPYSTEIAAAWQVVEHLLTKGAQISFANVDEGDPVRQWDVIVDQMNVADVSFPLALCRAALLDAQP